MLTHIWSGRNVLIYFRQIWVQKGILNLLSACYHLIVFLKSYLGSRVSKAILNLVAFSGEAQSSRQAWVLLLCPAGALERQLCSPWLRLGNTLAMQPSTADTGQVQLSDQIDFHGHILFCLLVKPVILFRMQHNSHCNPQEKKKGQPKGTGPGTL